jgi:hypothetical protein
VSSNEERHFVTHIKKAIASALKKPDINSTREFTHEFSHGTYIGEWKNGCIFWTDFLLITGVGMHGKGVYILGSSSSLESKRFDGYWDSTLRAGYGHVIPPVDPKAANMSVVKRQKYEATWTVEGNNFWPCYSSNIYRIYTSRDVA